ncbi:N-acyl homoserine lactonase family protein [Vibrio sp. SCSIO 43132]|uniref:N-acyl homoserine lactonase family protein n=1 Tax=Vibrio sp. SCSIO 43132 TaxID=2779363 RepID=UPI001CA7C35E|nr:N-acyl homoserine lactonase family protein [Vibrio sp. SCSIO 43132]UAB71234.1 N-acyl homoserine lactonase family protein [Vibrio sp. SCSIO 43132]
MKIKSFILALVVSPLSFAQISQPEFSTDGSVDVSVSVLDCGRIESRKPSMFNPKATSEKPLKMVNSCYVISHPKGKLFWDAGINDEFITQKDGIEVMDGAFHFSVKKTLSEQLQTLNVSTKDFDYIALSHLHWDHSGNATKFQDSTWLVQKPEFDVAFDTQKLQNYGFNLSDYQHLQPKAKVIEGDHQVFGDGSVVLISAYGHSPGHQVLYIDLPQHGPIILSGDLYHTRENYKRKAIPIFNQKEQTVSAFKKVDAILKQTGAELWIGHDATEFSERKLAPYLYR